jgi:hypothetical protein
VQFIPLVISPQPEHHHVPGSSSCTPLTLGEMEAEVDPATLVRLVTEQVGNQDWQVDYARLVDLTVKQQYEDLRQLFHRWVHGNSSPHVLPDRRTKAGAVLYCDRGSVLLCIA